MPALYIGLRRFRIPLFFAIGFLICETLLTIALPLSNEPLVNEKFAEFLQHKDEVTGLFLGTSVTYRQIDPVIIDDVLEKKGIPSLTLNFGLDGMLLFEAEFLLKKILAAHPKRLQFVGLDSSCVIPRNHFVTWTARNVYWHDAIETHRAIRNWTGLDPNFERTEKAFTEFSILSFRLTNWGRLAENIKISQDSSRTYQERRDHRGFLPLDHDPKYMQELSPAERASQNGPAISKGEEAERLKNDGLHYFLEQSLASGLKVIFINGPRWKFQPDDSCQKPSCTALDFGDLKTYPVFQSENLFYDFRHLNSRGSRELSQLLAEKISIVLKESQP